MLEESLSPETTSGMSQSEMEIQHFFGRHLSTLVSQKWALIDQINQWTSTLIGLVQQHSTQQRDLVEQECMKKVSLVKTARDRSLQQILIYEQKKDTEQIHQLLHQCHHLKIKLGNLVHPERLIPSIQFITEDEQCQKQPRELHDNCDETKHVPTEAPSSTTDASQSINNHCESFDEIIDPVDLSEKCPICFMIFPRTRSIYQRNLHVNEHYNDD